MNLVQNFATRHNGPRQKDIEKMLKTIGNSSLDALIDETIPSKIRLKEDVAIEKEGVCESRYLKHLKKIASKNKIYKTYIGLGYYNTIVPSVVLRNILENPGWYTSYTPYQAEISQGRLEALLNYQTMVSDLTGLPIANSSLLDEATAGAEAMIMMFNSRSRDSVKRGANKCFVSNEMFPQTIDVLKTRSNPLGMELVIGDFRNASLDDSFFGAIIQYPVANGEVYDYADFVKSAHEKGLLVSVGADILSLALLTPPGEWGADIVFGSTQRMGVPMGFGGPSAGYFATKDEYKRMMPGRIIGVTVDANGNRAVRMALQTREQHIKRERATSNICTAQALLAIMSSFYAAYHGPEGLKMIASRINIFTSLLSKELVRLGYIVNNKNFFDTINVTLPASTDVSKVNALGLRNEINFRIVDEKTIGISLDETVTICDLNEIAKTLAEAVNNKANEITMNMMSSANIEIPSFAKRTSKYLTHPVFNMYHSETEMMRYMKKLERRDISLNHSMIPLGSCTMKLNAATELLHLSWPEFGNIHPFVPSEQAEGYLELIHNLEDMLAKITGFAATSLQPNSGAAGEYAGLMVIRQYHINNGNAHRNVVLIPASAHGTNPASAAMAGMKVVVVKCDDNGNIDMNDLQEKAITHKDDLSCLMVTYPSTHGVFEDNILDVTRIIHENGGQVYMDGANMNAQVGLTNPGFIGADVCHLNLHKTFAIPHGGGGPGQGPICVAKHLVPFLPSHPVVKIGGEKSIHAVAASPYGSASILPISYAYIKMMGIDGLKDATKIAILNANYIAERLKPYYKILYTGNKGHVAHELILDCNEFKRTADVEAIDMAKRLMDYGFHAPTVAFPVHGTLMVEPTESETIEELDRFCDAMIAIRAEIKVIEDGKADKKNNLLKNAPHTVNVLTAEEWTLPYSRKEAAFPLEWIKENKFWPFVGRVDDAYGDRNLVCTCEPIENYM